VVSGKKKPRGRPFTKGDARINRAGVPADAVEFSKRLRESLARELGKPYPEEPSGQVSNFQQLSARLVQLAVSGSREALQIVLERLAGRVPQTVTGAEGGPVQVQYVIEAPRPFHSAQGKPKHEQASDSARARRGLPAIPPAG